MNKITKLFKVTKVFNKWKGGSGRNSSVTGNNCDNISNGSNLFFQRFHQKVSKNHCFA